MIELCSLLKQDVDEAKEAAAVPAALKEESVRVLLLGDKGVGKTSACRSYVWEAHTQHTHKTNTYTQTHIHTYI